MKIALVGFETPCSQENINIHLRKFHRSQIWLSPEIRKLQNCDTKADIWSLGFMCVEMATGHHPEIIERLGDRRLDGTLCSDNFRNFIDICMKTDPT
jgi:serine/threonine protein kinase